MSTLEGLVFGFIAMIVLGFLLPALGRRSPTGNSSKHSRSNFRPSTVWLYYFSLGLLVASPLLSSHFVSTTKLRPAEAYLFLFIGLCVLLSGSVNCVDYRWSGHIGYRHGKVFQRSLAYTRYREIVRHRFVRLKRICSSFWHFAVGGVFGIPLVHRTPAEYSVSSGDITGAIAV